MSDVTRLFALAVLCLLLFSGCAGNREAGKPADYTAASTTSTMLTTTIAPTTTPASTTSSTRISTTTTSSSTTSTSSTIPDPYRPNPEATLIDNLTNTGFTATYENYSFSIGQLKYSSDKSIIGAVLHVRRPDGTYIDLSTMINSVDAVLDNRIMIRFTPTYAKDIGGVQTGAIYVWTLGNSTITLPNESATMRTGWIKIQSALNITYMEDGAFKASFINNAGADVKIDGVVLNETDTELSCRNILVDGRQASPAYPVTVKYGERFEISADCPPKEYDTGYFLEISISYKVLMENELIKHKETGHMRGRVRPYNEHYTP